MLLVSERSRRATRWNESPKRVEPLILVMSLTESPDDVERLALARVGIGWNYAGENAASVGLGFGSAARATEDIGTAQRPAQGRPDARVYVKRAPSIADRWRGKPTIVTGKP
jgi:hypothetical protein